SPCAQHYDRASLCYHRPRSSPLFPYTTLFRSHSERGQLVQNRRIETTFSHGPSAHLLRLFVGRLDRPQRPLRCGDVREQFQQPRSEEHTSELQSREKLVCRLLLERKN